MDLFQNNTIEKEFENLVKNYHSSNQNQTGIESVLQYLLDNKNKIWHFSWEFIGKVNSKGSYLSHRSPARASDLAIHYPEFVEDRKVGKYSVYRLRTENINKIKEFLNATKE